MPWSVGERGVCYEAWLWSQVEQTLVQILDVVATTQARSLRAEVGKGFMWTVIGHESVDPKPQINFVELYFVVYVSAYAAPY